MSGFIQQIMDSAQKRFEIFERFFNDKDHNLDYKTRIDEYEVEDMSYLHTLDDYFDEVWDYQSPIEPYLQRKKALRVSRNGEGRFEMMEILKQQYKDDNDNKSGWDKLVGM